MDVKVASTRDSGYFYVNWWLTDHCNWDCSYCHDEIKKGHLPFPGIRDVKDFLDQTHAHAKRLGRQTFIDLTGGEVTEYPFLQELLDHAKQLSMRIKLRTNASQSISAFTALVQCLDIIDMEFHPEHTQTSHFLLALNQAAQTPGLLVAININALPERWIETAELAAKIRAKWPEFSVCLKMLFEDPVRNTQPLNYQKPQIQQLKRQSGSLMIHNEQGHMEYSDYQSMILEDRNHFQGWQCAIGTEQIIVDAWGVVRRGHCRQGGSLGQIGSPIRFDTQHVTCAKPRCVNSFDILSTKIKGV